MKKRLKGLVSLWLAVVMVLSMMPVPAMAETAEYVSAFVSTADTSPVPGEWHAPFEWVNLELDTPLIEQDEIMNKLPIPAGGVLNGWKLWRTNSGGLVSEDVDPITIGKNNGIDQSTWSIFGNNGDNYLMIEQLWMMKYRINPQPSVENNYTVGGEILKATDENTGEETWETTTDVTYQWYKVTTEDKTYTVTNADGELQIGATGGNYANGSWESTADYWGDQTFDIYIPVQVGDVVTVTFLDTFTGTVKSYTDNSDYTSVGDKTYTKEMTEATINSYNGNHNLYITSGEAFTATITVTRSATTYTLLDGQTSKTLNTANLTASGRYVCDVTFNPSGDNVTLTSDEVQFTVVPVTNLTLEPTTLTMTVGDSETLTAAVTPDNATNKAVTWSSSNEDVATVDETGKVTAVKVGTATITVTTVDGGKTDTCEVTVTTTYTVTLDGNGLEYDMEIVAISGETATEAYNRVMDPDVQDAGEALAPTRDGYTFGGWYTDKDVWEAEYDFTKVVTEDITVIAKWTANSYTVRFNANGGEGTMADQSFTYDVAQNLTSNDFTRDGYTFIGWAENESGEVKYTDGQSVKNLTDAKDGTVDLYAKWEEDAPPVVDPPVIDPPVVISGTASLTKVDAEDPTTVLPGVVFELYQANGALIGTYTTNASGQITVYGLMPGTYYWRETRPAEGYILDGTEHVVTVYAGRTSSLVVKNERSSVPGVFGGDHDAYIIGSDGLVRPEANITRAEVATIFFRLLNEETRAAYMTDENTFADVNEGDWFNTAASTMAAMGIMTGLPDGGFHPMQNITRAEFAAVAARFDANGNATGASFADIYGHWAEDEINIAANNGWILGFDGKFRPDDLITRAEAMTMINRVLQRIPEHPDDLLDHMVTWPDNMDPSKWYYLAVQEATNSHNYGRKENGYEYWTGLRAVPDWAALED